MNESIAKALLHKLFRHGYIGAKHTAIENLPKGFPKHMHKEVMKTAEKLTKKGLLTLKPTSYGIHVSLNPHRIAEIEQKIRDP
jgi:hypothetical protein